MKTLNFLILSVSILLTLVEPIWAQEVPEPELVLNPRVNALVGLGQINPEGRSAPAGAAGGATIELGASWNTLETGLLMLRTGPSREASVALPLFAKFRVANFDKQSLYIKVGGMPAFESNGFDVLVGGGLGGRIQLSKGVDLIIDGTYNHGLVDSSPQPGTNQVAGFLVLTGLSFSI